MAHGLIGDDDEDIRLSMRLMLEDIDGHTVLAVAHCDFAAPWCGVSLLFVEPTPPLLQLASPSKAETNAHRL